jgi:hypothetical protein
MNRRNFIGLSTLTAAAGVVPGAGALAGKPDNAGKLDGSVEAGGEPATDNDRTYWADTLNRIASPVLYNMSRGQLKKNMPVEYSPIWDGRDRSVAYMEAFGRLLAGLAPWLALPDDGASEAKQRRTLREQALQSLVAGVDPSNPDYLTWAKEGQPLVDASYIAHAFLRAPATLWEPLDSRTKQRFIAEFKGLRQVRPAYNNWLLFAAMIEAFLLSIDEQYEPLRIDVALHKMNEWYVGDGWYSDGPHFHFDYYNGYVIQPMLVDIQKVLLQKDRQTIYGSKPSTARTGEYDLAVKRMQRYSEFLERLISPEGTYPAFGRSVTYRVGAFQPLVQLALHDQLPEGITPAQVRSALTAVMKRMFGAPGVFTKDGWLQLGFAGHQPGLADYYSNSGSMYITSLGFLPLGLPASHPFWSGPFTDWTSRKAWGGQSFKKDYAVDY